MWLFCSTFLYWVREKIFRWCIKLKYTALRMIVLIFVIIILLWLSIFLYGSFYFTYMPSVMHLKPVHLQFSRTCGKKQHMCEFPSANVSLFKEDGDGVLMYGQSYKIFLDLDMPESPVNQKLGMFMVKMNILAYNELLRSSSRATMLKYKSHLLQMIQAFVIAPLVIFGVGEEKQSIHINLFDNYIEDPYKPSRFATIEIQAFEIEIYSAMLRIHAHFTGLRYLMFNHPFIAFILGVGTNMIFLTAIALLSWYHCGWGREDEESLIRTISSTSGGTTSLLERQLAARQMLNDEKKSGHFATIQEKEENTSETCFAEINKDLPHLPSSRRSDLEYRMSTPKETAPAFETETENISTITIPTPIWEEQDDGNDSQESYDNVQEQDIPSPEQLKSDLRFRHIS